MNCLPNGTIFLLLSNALFVLATIYSVQCNLANGIVQRRRAPFALCKMYWPRLCHVRLWVESIRAKKKLEKLVAVAATAAVLGCRISTAHILYMWLWHAILHIGQLRSVKNAKHQYINNAKGKWLCQSAQFQSSIAFWSDTEALLFGYIRRGARRAFSDRHFVCLFYFSWLQRETNMASNQWLHDCLFIHESMWLFSKKQTMYLGTRRENSTYIQRGIFVPPRSMNKWNQVKHRVNREKNYVYWIANRSIFRRWRENRQILHQLVTFGNIQQ